MGSAALALVAAAVAVAILRDDGGGGTAPASLPVSNPGPVHVHGLGINPEDGALYIATHSGLWRSRRGETRSERVGENRQDTMGFTVAGPDYFLGSGHPDPQAAAAGSPSHLGLIRSTDAGSTWQTISLGGQADFHVLRASGDRIFGFDATGGVLLVSRDGGRSWSERPSPGPLVDLAVHPSKPTRVVAATESGLFSSATEGGSWTPLAAHAGLLAWPRPDRLYLATGDGDVLVSPDAGRRWARAGRIGGQPAAFAAAGRRDVYAALHDGTVKMTSDGGTTWTIRAAP